jgi:hypothetical protein
MRLLSLDPEFAVAELYAHGWLKEHPVAERARIAGSVIENSPGAAETLWQSILEEANSTETPHALFGLISLADPASAKVYANRLQLEFALSPQTEEARKKWPDLFR